MLLPLSDDDRKLIKPAYVTWALLILNGLIFLLQISDPDFTLGFAAVPAEITSGRDLVAPVEVELAPGTVAQIPHVPGPWPIQLTLLTSMFMHAGIMHLAGNMLFLWIFGDNVEHRFGHIPFLIFYLVSGLAASFAQIVTNPGSVIPTLGASGAIAGVLGAYLVLFPRNQVYVLFFIRIITVPAFIVIALWAVTQFVSVYGAIAHAGVAGGGVAYAAHVGGFVAGLTMALLVRGSLPEEPDTVFRRRYAEDPKARQLW